MAVGANVAEIFATMCWVRIVVPNAVTRGGIEQMLRFDSIGFLVNIAKYSVSLIKIFLMPLLKMC